jgi:hypothetical protein
VKAAARSGVARGVGAHLLHDDVDFGELPFAEAEARRVAVYGTPRRADLRLVLNLLFVEDSHEECGLRIADDDSRKPEGRVASHLLPNPQPAIRNH